MLVSTREEARPTVGGYEFRSFRIVDGVVTEEDVEVVESYMFAHTGADDVPDQRLTSSVALPRPTPTWSIRMAVTVSIPTILRTHTGGEKSVEAKGSTVAEVIDDLESRHSGIAARLVNNGNLHRFVNIYVDDEDVRFAGGLEAPVGENSRPVDASCPPSPGG